MKNRPILFALICFLSCLTGNCYSMHATDLRGDTSGTAICDGFIDQFYSDGKLYLFVHPGTNPIAAYAWSNGATASVIEVPLADSSYCVTVTDVMGESCVYCYNTCMVILANLDGRLTVASFLPEPVTYSWSNGSTSNFIYPDSTASIYCVTITDANGNSCAGCKSTAGCQLEFLVKVGGNSNTAKGKIHMIKYDSTFQGKYPTVKTVSFSNGHGHITGVNMGNYLVKAVLDPDSPGNDSHLPTYGSGNVLFWDEAQPVFLVANGWGTGIVLNLIAGQNSGGPGAIGGTVTEGANVKGDDEDAENEGDPLPNIQIIVTREDGTPVAAQMTNNLGKFGFSNLAYGTYKVWIDIPGIAPVYHLVSLSADSPTFNALAFKVNSNTATSDAFEPSNLSAVVSPNPVKDILQITSPLHTLGITLMDIQGNVLFMEPASGSSMYIPVHHYPAGIYLLRLQNAGNSVVYKIVKE